MSLILRKDPIVEAVCEFQLDAPDWDLTVPGAVYALIKNEFPEKRQTAQVNFQIEERGDGIHPSAQTSVDRMQFWSRSKTQVVQVGPQHLSVHQFKPYTGWPLFKSHIENILEQYEKAAPFRAIKAMSLRYINQIPMPHDESGFGDVLHTIPNIPGDGDQIWASWFQQVEIVKPRHNAILGLRCGHLPQHSVGNQAVVLEEGQASHLIMFDLIFVHIGKQAIVRESVSDWLEIAHEEISKMFFDSIVEEHLPHFEPEVKKDDAS